MRIAIVVVSCALSSCSIRTFYPTMGGVSGALAGAAISGGNPLAASAGAGAGVLVGELAKGNEDLKQAQQTISALSRGDVEGLIAAATGQQKGFIDEALDAVYGFVKLCLVGVVLWNLVPIIYTRYIHKKHTNGNVEKTKS